jgi:hypothetical protein
MEDTSKGHPEQILEQLKETGSEKAREETALHHQSSPQIPR